MATPTIAAPPRPDVNKKSGILSRQNFLGFINASNAQHFMKLRHNWKTSDQLRIEFGLDYCVNTNQTKPFAGVRLELTLADKPEGWAVEANTNWAILCTPKIDIIPFTDKISLPLDARIGKNWYDGATETHLDIGIHNGAIALVLGVVALATKKPIAIKRKETGGFYASMPITFKDGVKVQHTLQTRTEIDATLQRKDRGLQLDIHQLNGVLRLRQD